MPLEEDQTIVRELDVPIAGKTLKLIQRFAGDVNCVVWDASIALAKYLEELERKSSGYFRNKEILELGAGVGCVGLTAACLGANVTLTDLAQHLNLLQQNVKVNKDSLKGTVSVETLEWGQETDLRSDIVVLADCVYYRESIVPLIRTLTDISDGNTEILLSQELRETDLQKDNWHYFLENAKTKFKINEIPLEEQHPDFSSRDILILKLKKN